MCEGSGIGGRRNRLTIVSERLLLVEGQDEVNLLRALIRHHLGDAAGIQVVDVGGKNQFPTSLRAIQVEVGTHPTFRSLGVIRDADKSAESAFQSVCSQLSAVGYEPPRSHGGFSDTSPSVGVFIVPNGIDPGAIETLCRRSVDATQGARCVDRYLQCMEDHNALSSRNSDKSFTHAYLAAARNPVSRVGEGALADVWNLASPAFGELMRFIRVVAQ